MTVAVVGCLLGVAGLAILWVALVAAARADRAVAEEMRRRRDRDDGYPPVGV